MTRIKKLISGVTKKQCAEFGLVSILIAIFLALYLKQDTFVTVALILTLLTIIVPAIFFPFAICWFGLSKILSVISSAILITTVFFLVVIPVGLFRKLFGTDSLKIRQFRKGKGSVMLDRNHLFEEADLIHTF